MKSILSVWGSFALQVGIHNMLSLSYAFVHNNAISTIPCRPIKGTSSNRASLIGPWSPSPASSSVLILFSSPDDKDGGKKKKGSDKSSSSPKKGPSKKGDKKSKSTSSKTGSSSSSDKELKDRKKQEIMSKLKAKLESNAKSKKEEKGGAGGLLDKLNPFQAGQNLRKTIGTLTTLGSGLSEETKQKYFLDDRLRTQQGSTSAGGGEGAGTGAALFSERNPYLERLERDNYVPEVLVIGATGAVGRLVVRRLLLEGKFRVRVLVRDLYSKTLNLLGTGVTYCRGDLGNIESLEYALTDVDKIVFCAGAPRPDEADFQTKFQYFVEENLAESVEGGQPQGSDESSSTGGSRNSKNTPASKVVVAATNEGSVENDTEWEQLDSILQVRAQLAEQVDYIGMQNLIKAYQNVRHADYGTSQAAKRSLFKFTSRPEDFSLFSIDEGDSILGDNNNYNDEEEDEGDKDKERAAAAIKKSPSSNSKTDYYDDEFPDEDPYNDYYDDDDEDDFDDSEYTSDLELRKDATVQTQCRWLRNEFGRAVFVGKVPKAESSGGVGGEASVVSSRLRSRDEPELGIDLSAGFGGFIVRLVADGGNYEAFARTRAYEESGIEYVCEFSTATKPTRRGNKSRNKYITVRLPFRNFKPVLRRGSMKNDENKVVEAFKGSDVQNIGFRYRSASNEAQAQRTKNSKMNSFYVAFSFIKVYRLQPEPEFVYLSDARIPRVITNGMVRHDRRQLLTASDAAERGSASGRDDMVQILDEKALQDVNTLARSKEETYYKLRGEETLKNSGLRYECCGYKKILIGVPVVSDMCLTVPFSVLFILCSYTIVRVSGFNELPGGEASTIELDAVSKTHVVSHSPLEALAGIMLSLVVCWTLVVLGWFDVMYIVG
jgi:hypothetical protein